MKIRFLVDYRGVLTGEEYFLAGAVADGLENAEALVAEGRAEVVESPPEPAPTPRRSRKK